MSVPLLYSGGLDSACAWWILGKPPALHFNGPYGPARDAGEGERVAIRKQCAISAEFAGALKIALLDFRPFMRDGVWQCPREQVCALVAWGAGYDGVQIAFCQEDKCLPDIGARIRAAVPFAFEVRTPFLTWDKPRLVREALEHGAPREFLEASHSCVRGDVPCGQCTNCKERESALAVFA